MFHVATISGFDAAVRRTGRVTSGCVSCHGRSQQASSPMLRPCAQLAPQHPRQIRRRCRSRRPSSANVAAPGSRIAAIARSTKNVSVMMPGARPITVPSRKSLQRMCDAPATTLTIENGAIGSIAHEHDRRSPRSREPARQIVERAPGEPAYRLPTQMYDRSRTSAPRSSARRPARRRDRARARTPSR